MQIQTSSQKIRISEPIISRNNAKFNIRFDRESATLESSFKGYSNGDNVLFIKGHPRDEELCLLTPQAFQKRIEKTFDGILGTTGLYCGMLLDRSTQKLSIFCDPHAAGLLYWYTDDHQILISDNLDWVVKHCGRKLHIDGVAWSELINTHVVKGDRTYFEEIKCLELQQIITFDAFVQKFTCDNKFWYLNCITPYKNQETTYADIVNLFQEGIFKYKKQFPKINLALSGGMDSRLVLVGMVKNGVKVITYTTDTDIGFNNDRVYAAITANEFNIINQYLELDQHWYENTVDDYYLISSYECWWHVWFQGFINNLPNLKYHNFFTGNYGDGLLKICSSMPIPSDDLDEMFSHLNPKNFFPIIKQKYIPVIINNCSIGFKKEYSRYAGLPSSIQFFRMNNRDRRNNSWMARQVSTKTEWVSCFQYPPLQTYVLGLPNDVKFSPTFEIDIMRTLDSHIFDYPSTQKTMWQRHIHSKIRKFNFHSVKKFASILLGKSMINDLGYLDIYLTKKLFNIINDLALNHYYHFEKTQPIYMFAKWLETYQDYIHYENVFD